MKRSSFLATLAGLLTFRVFKKKPKWDYGHVSTELEPLKWVGPPNGNKISKNTPRP